MMEFGLPRGYFNIRKRWKNFVGECISCQAKTWRVWVGKRETNMPSLTIIHDQIKTHTGTHTQTHTHTHTHIQRETYTPRITHKRIHKEHQVQLLCDHYVRLVSDLCLTFQKLGHNPSHNNNHPIYNFAVNILPHNTRFCNNCLGWHQTSYDKLCFSHPNNTWSHASSGCFVVCTLLAKHRNHLMEKNDVCQCN